MELISANNIKNCLLIFLCSTTFYDLITCEILTSPLVTHWGDWGDFEHCPQGTFVIGFQLKTEPWSWLGPFYDDTSLNAIRFYCGDPSVLHNISDNTNMKNTNEEDKVAGVQKIISSTEGDWGKWGEVFMCNADGFAIGFMLRTEEEGTAWLDETATNNLRLLCSGSTTGFIEGDGESWGEWTTHRICPNDLHICGLQTQVQEYQGFFRDDTSLNNIRVECCNSSTSQPNSLNEERL